VPTSSQEAESILKISSKYLSPTEMKDLFQELNDEIGKNTDNSSLKVSLEMMAALGQVNYEKWSYALYQKIRGDSFG